MSNQIESHRFENKNKESAIWFSASSEDPGVHHLAREIQDYFYPLRQRIWPDVTQFEMPTIDISMTASRAAKEISDQMVLSSIQRILVEFIREKFQVQSITLAINEPGLLGKLRDCIDKISVPSNVEIWLAHSIDKEFQIPLETEMLVRIPNKMSMEDRASLYKRIACDVLTPLTLRFGKFISFKMMPKADVNTEYVKEYFEQII